MVLSSAFAGTADDEPGAAIMRSREMNDGIRSASVQSDITTSTRRVRCREAVEFIERPFAVCLLDKAGPPTVTKTEKGGWHLSQKGASHLLESKNHANRVVSASWLIFGYVRTFKIWRAAFCPGPPVTPPPGWVPDPHRNRPGIGVWYRAWPRTGRMVNN